MSAPGAVWRTLFQMIPETGLVPFLRGAAGRHLRRPASAGHSISTLLFVYAHCTDGQDTITSHQINQTLDQPEPPVPPRSKSFRGLPATADSYPSYGRARPAHGPRPATCAPRGTCQHCAK